MVFTEWLKKLWLWDTEGVSPLGNATVAYAGGRLREAATLLHQCRQHPLTWLLRALIHSADGAMGSIATTLRMFDLKAPQAFSGEDLRLAHAYTNMLRLGFSRDIDKIRLEGPAIIADLPLLGPMLPMAEVRALLWTNRFQEGQDLLDALDISEFSPKAGHDVLFAHGICKSYLGGSIPIYLGATPQYEALRAQNLMWHGQYEAATKLLRRIMPLPAGSPWTHLGEQTLCELTSLEAHKSMGYCEAGDFYEVFWAGEYEALLVGAIEWQERREPWVRAYGFAFEAAARKALGQPFSPSKMPDCPMGAHHVASILGCMDMMPEGVKMILEARI